MSRAISFVILIPKQNALRADQLASIGRAVKSSGFGFANPHLGRIMVLGGGGEGHIPIADEAALFEYFAARPTGLVSVWKGGMDVAIDFDTAGTELAERAVLYGADDDPVFGAVTLNLNRVNLRDPAAAGPVLQSVLELFGRLCACLAAPFGFALDELGFEVLARDWHVQREVAARTVPSVALPVCYYSAAHFTGLSKVEMDRPGFACRAVESAGYLAVNLEELL